MMGFIFPSDDIITIDKLDCGIDVFIIFAVKYDRFNNITLTEFVHLVLNFLFDMIVRFFKKFISDVR